MGESPSSTDPSRAEQILPLAAPIEALLLAAGVEWCWLREREHIGSAADGLVEFDAWCSRATFAQAAAALLRAGWQVHSGRTIAAGGRILSAQLRFDRPGPETGTTLRLELASGALRYAALPYQDEPAVLRDIRTVDGIPYAGGATLLAILITRCALRGDLAENRLRRARTAWTAATPTEQDAWRRDAARLLGAGKARSVARALVSSDDAPPVPRGGASRATLRYYLARPLLVPNVVKWLRARRAKGRANPRGFVVSFIGTDGAGKSTTIEAIRKRLEADGHAVHVTYWGRARGKSALAQGLRDAVTRVTGIAARDAKPPSDPGRAAPPSWPERCVASAGAAVYLLDYWYRQCTEVHVHARRGGIVLMDRGPTDLKVMYAAFAPARSLWKLAPRAALTVHCTADSATVLRRKRERSAEVVEAHLRDYAEAIHWLRHHRAAAMEYSTEGTGPADLERLAAIVRAVGRVQAGHLDPELLRVLTG